MSRDDTIRKYRDIIYTERPLPETIARKHPKMNLLDRAKIFAPFAALSGHGTSLLHEDWKTLRIRKSEMSDEDTAILSDKLAQVQKNMTVNVVYFSPDEESMGTYSAIDGIVSNIDAVYQTITVNGRKIRFEDILDINGDGILVFNPEVMNDQE